MDAARTPFLWDVSEVLLAAGKKAAALDALEQALGRYEWKKTWP